MGSCDGFNTEPRPLRWCWTRWSRSAVSSEVVIKTLQCTVLRMALGSDLPRQLPIAVDDSGKGPNGSNHYTLTLDGDVTFAELFGQSLFITLKTASSSTTTLSVLMWLNIKVKLG
ncbi:hypothetical protein O9992_20855 [Vibrio lentus]|nr:hypothetical protein [Vibrio lentus]